MTDSRPTRAAEVLERAPRVPIDRPGMRSCLPHHRHPHLGDGPHTLSCGKPQSPIHDLPPSDFRNREGATRSTLEDLAKRREKTPRGFPPGESPRSF